MIGNNKTGLWWKIPDPRVPAELIHITVESVLNDRQ